MTIGEKAFRTKYKIRNGSTKNALKAYLREQKYIKKQIRQVTKKKQETKK